MLWKNRPQMVHWRWPSLRGWWGREFRANTFKHLKNNLLQIYVFEHVSHAMINIGEQEQPTTIINIKQIYLEFLLIWSHTWIIVIWRSASYLQKYMKKQWDNFQICSTKMIFIPFNTNSFTSNQSCKCSQDVFDNCSKWLLNIFSANSIAYKIIKTFCECHNRI